RVEAAAAGGRVSVLCPGLVRTPIIEGGGKFGKLLPTLTQEQQQAFWQRLRPMWERLSPMAPDQFAEKVLRALARNKPVILVPAWWKIYLWLYRFCPWWVERLSAKSLRDMAKIMAEVAPEAMACQPARVS